MATYKLIASSVASGGAVSSVAFTSIPSTYTDLVLTCSWRASTAGSDQQLWLSINNTSYADIPYTLLQSDSSTLGGARGTSTWIVGGGNANGSTAGVFTTTLLYITNYSSTSTNKIFIIDSFMGSMTVPPTTYSYTEGTVRNFDSTTVISSLNLKSASGNLMQYSSFYLYGISNA
jgi:hypothetical protein